MGLQIMLVEETAAWVVAKERLWLTANRDRLVAEGDKQAAFLYVGVGKRFPRADAERYGLLDNADIVAAEPEIEPVVEVESEPELEPVAKPKASGPTRKRKA